MRGKRKINSPTQPGFKQNTDASPLKGQILKAVADAGGLPSPDSKQSKIGAGGPNKRSRRESNVSRKRVLSQDVGCATELKRLPTPINLFEDECVFCHSFRTTESFHGPMVRYLNGRVLSIDEGNSSNAIYVHKECIEWAPKVWFDGDVVMNLESEIRRASGLRCRRCGLLGAALGCYEKHCRKSYHVPCAVQIIDCRWDAKGHVLCPEHVSKTLPCDKLRTHRKENYSSSLRQSHCSCKEEPFTNFEEEGQQSHLHNTTSSFSPVGKCADKEGNLYVRHRETQQTDQLNTSNTSSFPQSQPSHKEGISPNSSRGGKQMDQLNSMSFCLPGSLYTKKEENFDNHQRKNQQTAQLNISNPFYLPRSQDSQKEGISTNNSRDGQIDQLDTSSSSSLPLGQHSYDKATSKNRERDNQQTHECNTSNLSSPQSCHPAEGISIAFQGEETTADQPDTSNCPSDQLVLSGLSLSVSEKDFLQNFAYSTNATLMEEWSKDVTHVIVAKGAGSSCSRSFEVLMAILLGRWVVHFEWVAGCLGTTLPVPEAAYEVAFSMGSDRTIDGPKKGRMRAAEAAPNLFSGLCFCLSDYMNPDNRDRMRDLIATAEGRVLERRDLHLQLKNPDDSSVKPYFIYDVDAPAEFSSSTLHKEMEEVREQAAAGAQVICHLKVLDAIAAYDAEILNVKDSFTS
ncbi:BRCA1-associated RING domain protein 1-like isoform X2 [Miscanthus floridulus]|uniref:BRCA1-associated RING domain protein 1-like isoform X2 n=1 Tax=Miscanthus floridulus TaxID=154761 RepID=UPI00345A1307